MGKSYRIRVSGAPRHHPDPVLLAHIVILLGRHLHHQQARRGQSDTGTEQPAAGCPVPRAQGVDGDG